jgi:signal transduction histidine kinase
VAFFRSQRISENFEDAIEEILTFDNYNRTVKLSMILFLSCIPLFLTDQINRAKGLWIINDGYYYLFQSHVVLCVVSLIFVIISRRFHINSVHKISLFHQLYVVLYGFFLIILAAIMSGWVDQKIHGQITVYMIACMTIAVMFNYKLRVKAILYVSSLVIIMILLTTSQNDLDIRQGNYINSSLSVLLSYSLSTIIYRLKYQDLVHHYYLEELVNERTKELKIANDSLSQEMAERNRAEKEMARLDRLNLIGQMAASISHEVRNPMTTVKGFLQLLRHKQEAKDQQYFDLMIEEIERANSILTEFLSISKTKSTEFELRNLNEIISLTLPLIQADAQNQDLLLSVELNDVPDLQLNFQEIRQLLLNLVRNGFEAMTSGGTLRIRTSVNNNEVDLAISDEGDGIEQTILEQLGIPFFTTKEQGVGLGLAVCYGIVSRHNGRISIETSPVGSTFHVYFKLTGEAKFDEVIPSDSTSKILFRDLE